MRALALALVVLLLAGCNGPEAPKGPLPSIAPAAPAPSYDVAIVVTQETPDGAPLQAEVQAYPLRADGSVGSGRVQNTDSQGAARFSFREPTTLLVRVSSPGWTSEGGRVHIGTAVAAEGLTVSDHDVFVPLYRASLALAVQHAWSTVTAEPGPDGLAPAATFAPLRLPAGLEQAYLERLSDAVVTASWMDGVDGRAGTLATGLAWNGVPWVVGEESSALAAGGERKAVWDGDLPADRPADLGTASLQAALQTGTAIVGEVLFDVDVTLRFGGRVPAGLPADECHELLC